MIPILDIEDLSVVYRRRSGPAPAVSGLSLTVGADEAVALVGESGCGKSTLAYAVMRHLGRAGVVTGGRIRFRGVDLLALPEREMRSLRGGALSMVYQEPFAALNPCLTVEEQLVEVPMAHAGMSRKAARERAAAILSEVRLPDTARVLGSYPHQLSGGQQQRVVIAMALLAEPALLICDEPTTALDVTVEAGIIELLNTIRETRGTAILLISHNLGLVRESCDRISVMYAGEVVEEGPVAKVFAHPVHPYTRGLFRCVPTPLADKRLRPLEAIRGHAPMPGERAAGCAFAPRCDWFAGGICDADPVPLVRRPDGRTDRCRRFDVLGHRPHLQPPAPAGPEDADRPAGRVLLEAVGVAKTYPIDEGPRSWLPGLAPGRVVRADEDVSLTVREAETVAIVGESGCGKSTFARILMGLERASGGEIRFDGEEIATLPVEKRSARMLGSMQMIFQNPNDTLNPSMTVGTQLMRAIRRFSGDLSPERARERMETLLALVKLPADIAERRPRELSGGQKQRVGVARAFAGRPDLVVADEPVSALDVSVQAAVTRLLLDIRNEHGTSLVFISHDLSLVRYLADRIVVMYLGRIMERGTADEVFAPPYHPYTEALLAAVPVADPAIGKRRIVLDGTLPSPTDPPPGCPFASRCPRRLGAVCDTTPPPTRTAGDGHAIACHIPLDDLRAVKPVFHVVEAERHVTPLVTAASRRPRGSATQKNR